MPMSQAAISYEVDGDQVEAVIVQPSPGEAPYPGVAVCHPHPSVGGDMHGAFGGHGGGDERLVDDFIRAVRGEQPSISTTTIGDSASGHLMGFCADRAMEERRVVEIDAEKRDL